MLNGSIENKESWQRGIHPPVPLPFENTKGKPGKTESQAIKKIGCVNILIKIIGCLR